MFHWCQPIESWQHMSTDHSAKPNKKTLVFVLLLWLLAFCHSPDVSHPLSRSPKLHKVVVSTYHFECSITKAKAFDSAASKVPRKLRRMKSQIIYSIWRLYLFIFIKLYHRFHALIIWIQKNNIDAIKLDEIFENDQKRYKSSQIEYTIASLLVLVT